ncbi:MAG TPA: hypothetical protein PK340_01160 [Bacilli bacterium]|nr:hypothetical protein [Bacilli bacterium]
MTDDSTNEEFQKTHIEIFKNKESIVDEIVSDVVILFNKEPEIFHFLIEKERQT